MDTLSTCSAAEAHLKVAIRALIQYKYDILPV